MSKDMLGIAVRKLVTLPEGTLGLVCDLLEKLADSEWVDATKKFLRKENPWLVVAVPDDTVEFELTMVQAPDPLDMVREDGYDNWRHWTFHGPAVLAPAMKTFVLLDLGHCSNRDEAKEKADQQGFDLAEGQWRTPFRQKFGKPTRNVAVIVAGSKWTNPDGNRSVLVLHGSGDTWCGHFGCSDEGFSKDCRWLASRKPEEPRLYEIPPITDK